MLPDEEGRGPLAMAAPKLPVHVRRRADLNVSTAHDQKARLEAARKPIAMEPSRGAAPVYDDEALQGVGTFLTEHHQYIAVQTMEKIAGMQKQLVESFEAQGRARDEAHAREVADLREANESLKHQLDLLRHSMGGLVRDSESASWTAAQRHLAGKKALNKQNIFLSWVRVAATEKADRLLTHLAVALCKRNVKAKCLGAWHRYVHGSHSARAQARAEQKLKNVTSEIVGRYESELDKLRARVTLLQGWPPFRQKAKSQSA